MSEANQKNKKINNKKLLSHYIPLQKRSEKVNPSPLPSSDAYELYAIPVWLTGTAARC